MFNKKEYMKEYNKRYREEHIEYFNDYEKSRYNANKEFFREKSKNYRLQEPEKIKEYNAEWYEMNKDYYPKYHQEHPEKFRDNHLKFSYGIDTKIYNQMLKEQNGLCAICGKEETVVDNRTNKIRRLAVDHNHKTGKVRGLLCGNCNKSLGGFQEKISILQLAIQYLKKDKK